MPVLETAPLDVLVLAPGKSRGWFRANPYLWELEGSEKPTVLEQVLTLLSKLRPKTRRVLTYKPSRAFKQLIQQSRYDVLTSEPGDEAFFETLAMSVALSNEPRPLLICSASMPFIPFSHLELMLSRFATRHAGQHAMINLLGDTPVLPLLIDSEHRSVLSELIRDRLNDEWLETYAAAEEEHALFFPHESACLWFRQVKVPEDLRASKGLKGTAE